MKIAAGASLVDVAFAVCTALENAGVTCVLTGESAATFYTDGVGYMSNDVDFVITRRASAAGGDVLRELGFVQTGQFYRHPDVVFTLDFPLGPLAVGDDRIDSWSTVRRTPELLHVLTPTDCCRDRLASYLFWNDVSGLNQALLVFAAQRSKVKLKLIEDWCAREGHAEKFKLFKAHALRRGAVKRASKRR